MPLAGDGPLAFVETLQKLGREVDDPTMHGGVVDVQASLGHHLFQITQAQIVGQIPPHSLKDHGLIEVPAFEH
ncbi:hypothetical protein X732_32590 [Mesorhizobium sp. L2C066B000]|nr:hypothetical protein X732_32590 [Mesorhizobium sp. L2C066B000]